MNELLLLRLGDGTRNFSRCIRWSSSQVKPLGSCEFGKQRFRELLFFLCLLFSVLAVSSTLDHHLAEFLFLSLITGLEDPVEAMSIPFLPLLCQ